MTISRPILSQGFFSRFTGVRIILRMGVSSVHKQRDWRACLFVCSTCLRALVVGVLAYLASLRAYMLSSLACLRACSRAPVLDVLAVLACLRAWCAHVYVFSRVQHACLSYVFTCSHVLHACGAQISYVLTSLRASLTSFVLFSKNSYVKKFLFIQRSIKNHLNIYEGVFAKKNSS